jgi:hypothetical protein
MPVLYFLGLYPALVGQGEDWRLFSALRISEYFKISLYKARQLVEEMREAGLIRRVGNQYMLNTSAIKISNELAELRERSYIK